MVDTQRRSQTGQDIAVTLPVLFVLMFCLNAVFCVMFCPPAVENSSYNITAEKYNLGNSTNLEASWYFGSFLFADCNLTTLLCETSSYIPEEFWYHVTWFGHGAIQLVVGTERFIPALASDYSVLWKLGRTHEMETCSVAIGSPINECSTLDPCVNATACIDLELGYKCVCIPGYIGKNCKEGDQKLYCGVTNYTIEFPLGINHCVDIEQNCYVAGLAYSTHINLNYILLGNNTSPALQVNGFVLGKNISFKVCVSSSISAGTYQVVYELQSPLSVSPFHMKITGQVTTYNTVPEFNTPLNGGPYVINITEDTGPLSKIATVYKSLSQSCNANTCIQVIDQDTGPSNGIQSLNLTVSLENMTFAPISFQDNITNVSLGYFFISGYLTPSTVITYNLMVKDGRQGFASAKVVFKIIDVNEPPVCSIEAVTADLDIRSQPDVYIGTIHCSDNDVDATFKKITYSITGKYAGYFRVSENGMIVMYAAVKVLDQGLLNFYVTATGYSATPNSSYVFTIPVYINFTIPEPKCNLTVSRVPVLWKVNSSVDLKLECETWGVDKLRVLNWTSGDVLTVDLMNQSSTIINIKLTLKIYVYTLNFQVIVTIGGRPSVVTTYLAMYNPPKFSAPAYEIIIQDTILVGSVTLTLNATSEIVNAVFKYKIKSGDDNSYFMLDNKGNLSVAKTLQRVAGLTFHLVCEVQDSVSNLTDITTVNVAVHDNNELPVCIQPAPVMISSNQPPDNVITTISCDDFDFFPQYKTLSYSILCEPSTVQMRIRNNGDIVLHEALPAGISFVMVLVNVSDISLSTFVKFNITITVIKCLSEITQYGLLFPETPINSEVAINCPEKHSGQISRRCYSNQTWGPVNYDNCSRSDLKNITNLLSDIIEDSSQLSPENVSSKVNTIADSLSTSLSASSTLLPKDVKQVVEIFNKVGDITKQFKTTSLDGDTVKSFASAADVLFSADDRTWKEASKDNEEGAIMLNAMDNILTAGLRDEQPVDGVPFVTKHLALTTAISRDDIIFPHKEERSNESESSWVGQTKNTIYIPKKTFANVKDAVKYSVVLYKNVTDKFKINQTLQNWFLSNKVLNSDVLTLVINITMAALSPPLVLNFSVANVSYSNPSCGYLDTSASVPGVWATEGCTTVNFDDIIQCSCNHLTNFAVLMSPYHAGVYEQALSIISAVGCGISIFSLLVTIIVYICLWKYVKCDRSVLHINLSVFLILAYVVFLVGVDKTDKEIECKVVAALLHYLFLAVFFIMLSEGIELFKSVSFVFSAESILCKLIALSYGVPAVIVAVSLGVTRTEGYGNKDSCWLSTKGGLIWAFVGPVLLVILINIIILIQVLRIMQRTKQMVTKSVHLRTMSVIRTICILSPLLGITWIFGVLSVDQSTIFFQFLFAIFNSLQGVVIFIFYCILNPQVRDGFRALKRKHRAQSFDSSQRTMTSSFSGKFQDSRSSSDRRTNFNSESNSQSATIHDSSLSDSRKDSECYQKRNIDARNDVHHNIEKTWSHSSGSGSGHEVSLAYTDSGEKNKNLAYDNSDKYLIPLAYMDPTRKNVIHTYDDTGRQRIPLAFANPAHQK